MVKQDEFYLDGEVWVPVTRHRDDIGLYWVLRPKKDMKRLLLSGLTPLTSFEDMKPLTSFKDDEL